MKRDIIQLSKHLVQDRTNTSRNIFATRGVKFRFGLSPCYGLAGRFFIYKQFYIIGYETK